MSIFPNSMSIDIPSINTEKSFKKGYKDIMYDVDKKEIVIKDGNVVIGNKKQLVKQWIYLLINTEINKYKVYQDTNFGIVFLYEIKGKELYSSGFTIAQIKDELIEKIEEHGWVDKVDSIEIEMKFMKLIIKIIVILDEELIESEVIINV